MSEPSDAVRQLAAATELADVGFSHLAATREQGRALTQDDSGEMVSPVFTLRIETKGGPLPDGSAEFRVFLRCDVDLDHGPASAEVVASFRTKAGAVPYVDDRALLLEYINEVAIMVCAPYLRQGLADMTQRVFGYPLVMPIMPRGSIRFDQTTAAAD